MASVLWAVPPCGVTAGGGENKGVGAKITSGEPRRPLPPPLVDPILGGWRVGRSAARLPGGGLVGTPTYIPQNDPHDTLIILNMHK